MDPKDAQEHLRPKARQSRSDGKFGVLQEPHLNYLFYKIGNMSHAIYAENSCENFYYLGRIHIIDFGLFLAYFSVNQPNFRRNMSNIPPKIWLIDRKNAQKTAPKLLCGHALILVLINLLIFIPTLAGEVQIAIYPEDTFQVIDPNNGEIIISCSMVLIAGDFKQFGPAPVNENETNF